MSQRPNIILGVPESVTWGQKGELFPINNLVTICKRIISRIIGVHKEKPLLVGVSGFIM